MDELCPSLENRVALGSVFLFERVCNSGVELTLRVQPLGRTRRCVAAAVALVTALSLNTALPAEDAKSEVTPDNIEMSPISGPPDEPRRHFRLRFPADLTPEDASAYYEIIREALGKGYSRSGLSAAQDYQNWRRYNRTPYRSNSHGKHYLNNYANGIASEYGEYEDAGTLPVGSVIAKDSFAVTETGGILLGPLAIMEKMPKGFNYVSGDWRYTLVQPNGEVLGRTKGEGAESVKFCISCHLAVEEQDHLYFIPKKYRVDPGQ